MPYFDREFRKKLYEEKLAAGLTKAQLVEKKESELKEEVLKTAASNKSFSIGDKVRILKGNMQGKIGSVNYCNAGKCVIKLGDDQLFFDIGDLDYASEKPLDETIVEESLLNENEDDIEVKVDGEVVADTSTEEIEPGEVALQPAVEGSVEEFGPKLGITDMLLQAINDENTTIQAYNNLIAACNDEGFHDIANVIKHINEEENIHVGMLQYAMQTISDQAKEIDKGVQEAEEIISGNIEADHETLDSDDDSKE